MDYLAASAILYRLVLELREWFPNLEGKVLSLITIVVGIVVSIGFDIRVAAEVFGLVNVHVVFEYILSGFAVASMGGGIHKFLKDRRAQVLTGTGGREILGVIDRTKKD